MGEPVRLILLLDQYLLVEGFKQKKIRSGIHFFGKIVIDTKYLKKKQLVRKQIRCQSVSVGLEGAKRRDDYNMKLLGILNTKKKYSVKEVRSLWYKN